VHSVLALILGGGQGSRLFPLTHLRSKPAVPIGGKYRLIDVPISNCLHADIRRIHVLTQFNSASLNRHVSQTYRYCWGLTTSTTNRHETQVVRHWASVAMSCSSE
jgi:glucose-1-phosphate adenylyltransferase